MLVDIGEDFSRGLLNRFRNAVQNLPDLRWRTAGPRFAELTAIRYGTGTVRSLNTIRAGPNSSGSFPLASQNRR